MFLFSQNTKPVNLGLKVTPYRPLRDRVFFGDCDISMKDFMAVIVYVLTVNVEMQNSKYLKHTALLRP